MVLIGHLSQPPTVAIRALRAHPHCLVEDESREGKLCLAPVGLIAFRGVNAKEANADAPVLRLHTDRVAIGDARDAPFQHHRLCGQRDESQHGRGDKAGIDRALHGGIPIEKATILRSAPLSLSLLLGRISSKTALARVLPT